MEYAVKYLQFWGVPKYGFLGNGTVRVESGVVCLAGFTCKSFLLPMGMLMGLLVALLVPLYPVFDLLDKRFGRGLSCLAIMAMLNFRTWLKASPIGIYSRVRVVSKTDRFC